jgi:uncharacterized protein YkwD
MIARTFLLICLFLPPTLKAQSDPWSGWQADVLATLNTASDSEYLTEEEKKVILFMNMARHDGPLFTETFLQAYIQEKHISNSSYLRSLLRDLKKTRRLGPLMPALDLMEVARGHAIQSGKDGSTGHSGFNKRFEPLMGNPYTHVGENCSYGYQKAIDIVISLLIDEGIRSLGHRQNILSPDFNAIGVAIRPHKNYGINCVMDFGSH